jgi:hypothetical protein
MRYNIFPQILQMLSYRFARKKFLAEHPELTSQFGKRWANRIADTCICPDNHDITRIKGGGRIENGIQTMHNGLKVYADKYYGPEWTKAIELNKGVHEPQLEVLFHRVLNALSGRPVFVELGSYWAYYSMWFKQVFPHGPCHLIDIDKDCLEVGRNHFKLNGMEGAFHYMGVGSSTDTVSGNEIISLDDFAKKERLEKIDILLSDIQGSEEEMLLGASEMLGKQKIDWLFIATHVNHALHTRCKDLLIEYGYEIVCSINLDETFSDDGLIVAHSPIVSFPQIPHPSRRPRKLFQAVG